MFGSTTPPHPPTMELAVGQAGHGRASSVGLLLPPAVVARLAAQWLEEDAPAFDVAGFVVGDGSAEAVIWGKAKVTGCIVYGDCKHAGRRRC